MLYTMLKKFLICGYPGSGCQGDASSDGNCYHSDNT